MKKNLFYLLGSAGMLIGVILLFAHCETDASEMAQLNAAAEISADRDLAGKPAKDLCLCVANQYPWEDLSEAEKAAILYMREEEKLALDVYKAFENKWNARIFSNISDAEQRHADAVLCLIKKYGLTDPVGNNAAGVFQNATLQALYQSLMAEGAKSLPAALTVGAKIEDVDIYDLIQAKPKVDNADVRAVFEELERGSRNHLRAFVKNLANQNVTYKPEFISLEMFESIIAGPREKGGALCGTTCPNPGGKACPGGGQKGGKACNGTGPNNGKTCPSSGKACTGNGPNGNNGNCTGDGPKGKGPNGNGGNGNGPNGNGTGGN